MPAARRFKRTRIGIVAQLAKCKPCKNKKPLNPDAFLNLIYAIKQARGKEPTHS